MVDTTSLPPSVEKAIQKRARSEQIISELGGTAVGRGGTLGKTGRQTISELQKERKEQAVPRQEKTQEAIKAEQVAKQQAQTERKERILVQESPAQQALALEVAQQEVKASSKFEALRSSRLAEAKQKISEPIETSITLGGGLIRAEGTVSPFFPEKVKKQKLKAPEGIKERLQEKQIQQTEIRESDVDLSNFFKPKLKQEVETGIREQLAKKQIQQTVSIDLFGKKEFIKPSLENDPIALTLSGAGQLIVEPITDVAKFGFQLGKGFKELQEQEKELIQAKSEIEKKRIKERVGKTLKETFLTKEALTTGIVGTALILPPAIQKIAFTAFSGSEVFKFAEKPSFIQAGRLVGITTIIATPRVFGSVGRSIKQFKSAKFSSKLGKSEVLGSTFEKPFLEPTIQREFIDIDSGTVVKQFAGFKLRSAAQTNQLSVQPETGRLIQVTQSQFKPSPKLLTTDIGLPEFKVVQRQVGVQQRFLIKEGELTGVEVIQPIKKETVIEFIEPRKSEQTKVPEFLFQTEPRESFFDIKQPGELQGIKFPLGKESKIIRFTPSTPTQKPQPIKLKRQFQQKLGLFSGEIIPLGFEGKGFARPIKVGAGVIKGKQVSIFEVGKFQRVRPIKKVVESQNIITKNEIEIVSDRTVLKLKPTGLKKEDVFAGDVVFKGGAISEPTQIPRDISLPEFDIPNIGTGFAGITGFGVFDKSKIGKGFREKEKEKVGVAFKPKVDVGTDIKINFDTRFKRKTEIKRKPKTDFVSDFSIQTIPSEKIDIKPRQDIGSAQTPIIDTFPIIDTGIVEIPDIERPRKPKPPEQIEKLEPPLDLDIDVEGKTRKKKTGFNSLVKRKGKFIKINKEPLPFNRATNLALNEADSTPSVTAKIVRAKRPSKLPFDSFQNATLLNKFNVRKDREGTGNVFVEKNKFRIDSLGELRGITKKGQQARKKFGGFF